MKLTDIRSFVMIFFMAIAVVLIASSTRADALWIKVATTYGHHEDIRGKTFCVDFGICDVKVSWGMGDMPADNAKGVMLPVKADVADGLIIFSFKEPLDKKFMYPEGKYIFPIREDIEVSGKTAKEFGLKKFIIPKGNYDFDGQVLKIKLSDIKTLEKNSKKDGTN